MVRARSSHILDDDDSGSRDRRKDEMGEIREIRNAVTSEREKTAEAMGYEIDRRRERDR